jgi:pyruvate dehydrogenase E2 component (dihydrolipoamide acetyltransferase)
VPVIELLVKAGDTVKADQGLVTLESDKATMEVPAPFAGVVKELRVKVGDKLAEGSVVALIEAAGADAAAPAAKVAAAPAAPAAPPASAPAPAPAPARSDTAASAPPASAPAPAKAEPAATPSSPPVTFDAGQIVGAEIPYAGPAVRLFARELGVDLRQVKGSGRKGRITKEDVQAWVKGALAEPRTAPGAGSGAGLNLLPWPKVDFAKFGPIESKAAVEDQEDLRARTSRATG